MTGLLNAFLTTLVLWMVGIASARAAGPLERVENTPLTVPVSPPRKGLVTTNAFPALRFTQPVAITTPPGETNRLFVVEQTGRIVVLTNLANPDRTLFLDLSGRILAGGEQGLLGLAFHPGYATNGFFYVFYTLNTSTAAGNGRHDRLSRFQVSPDNPNVAAPASEQPLITQFDDYSNHNGGDLHFGPDGFLYVTLGDEGNQDDAGNNAQRIDKDFFAGILRIDVDQRPGSVVPNPHPAVSPGTYRIPADNPFVGVTALNGRTIDAARLRAEFYAIGLRNPWRISFDRETGHLYCGDVGGGLREEINIIRAGGNYGWAWREGTGNGPKASQAPAGFTGVAPIQQYAHGNGVDQGNSVTGGVVYRGRLLPGLQGAYVFADYVSGNVWSLRYDGQTATPMQRLTNDGGIAAFGVDPRNGELLLADHVEGRLKTLVEGGSITTPALPATLAATGAFADLVSLRPKPGVVPYEINVPFWSDGALKRRWFSLPRRERTIGFQREGNWTFPEGTVWVKHFELELTNGVPESTRRLETRFLVKTTNGVHGFTYRWDDSQTNAVLVAEGGAEERIRVRDGDQVREQVWQYPSRTACLACHTAVGGFALGFNAAQLSRDVNYGGTVAHQIQALSEAGYFDAPVTGVHALRTLVPADDEEASVEYRLRSYLAANCAQCHQPGGPGVGLFDARLTTTTTTAHAGLVYGDLVRPEGSIENNVIRPGWPQFSALLQRIATLGPGRMPPVGSSVLDTNAIALLNRWITGDAVTYEWFEKWQVFHFDGTEAPEAAPGADPDVDGMSNEMEFLVGTSPILSLNSWRVRLQVAGDRVQVQFPQVENRGFEVQVTTNPADPASWVPLDVPGNRPFFAARPREAVVEDSVVPGMAKFYRVRIYEL